jgi:AcrR family transcriptional regulator
MPMSPKRKKRLSRSDWLALAMEVLSKGGEAELRIDKLCRKLGVTKGSFYAHFENRADFVEQFVAHWSKTSTQSVIRAIDKLKDEAAEARLLALMRLLYQRRITGLEIAMRAWATRDSTVAQGVQATDELRFKYIQGIFHDMGFRGTNLDLRTRLFVVYHGGEPSMRLPSSGISRQEELKLRHAFFCRK